MGVADWIAYCETFSPGSVTLRLVIAAVLGGLIGIERGAKRKHAGLRTFSLVCLGAALAMSVNEYLYSLYPGGTDLARMGAQVISGIGFLGVGTIVVTGKNYVRGLTTAATLWSTAALGIAIGAGFLHAALTAFILIVLSITLLTKISRILESYSPDICLTMEVEKEHGASKVIEHIRERGFLILSVERYGEPAVVSDAAVITMEIHLKKRLSHEEILADVMAQEYVYYAEEN